MKDGMRLLEEVAFFELIIDFNNKKFNLFLNI